MRLISAREEQSYLDRILDLRAEAERVRTLNVELLDRLMAVQANAPPPPVQPLPKKPADRVMEVIGDVAGSNHQLRKQLGAFARAARAERQDDDAIIHTLMHWPEDDDGTAE